MVHQEPYLTADKFRPASVGRRNVFKLYRPGLAECILARVLNIPTPFHTRVVAIPLHGEAGRETGSSPEVVEPLLLGSTGSARLFQSSQGRWRIPRTLRGQSLSCGDTPEGKVYRDIRHDEQRRVPSLRSSTAMDPSTSGTRYLNMQQGSHRCETSRATGSPTVCRSRDEHPSAYGCRPVSPITTSKSLLECPGCRAGTITRVSGGVPKTPGAYSPVAQDSRRRSVPTCGGAGDNKLEIVGEKDKYVVSESCCKGAGADRRTSSSCDEYAAIGTYFTSLGVVVDTCAWNFSGRDEQTSTESPTLAAFSSATAATFGVASDPEPSASGILR